MTTTDERVERVQKSMLSQINAMKILAQRQQDMNDTLRILEQVLREIHGTLGNLSRTMGEVADEVLAEPAEGESLGDILKQLVAADADHAAKLRAVLDIVSRWKPATD
jgi:DNA repair ATPase RecN